MHATEAAVEAPPTLRGKYLLEDRLGEGGMAVVWRARHLLVERVVAIKMLRPEVARMPNVPQRFMQEARAAWLIDHPNVVSVLDVDVDDDGTPFIVQELLDGEDLEAHLARRGPLSPAELVALVAPALDALAAAHARGVVHRDLKPSNVFLARTARGLSPKLLDFGISRIATDDARMTSTGVVMGTPAYMAPEQIHSPKKVDARADLWAFGVMCYELLSGALPFESESSGELLVKICTTEPRPLRDVAPAVPAALESLVMGCLRRDPAARPASAESLLRSLRALESGGALVAAARDLATAATAIGHRPELPAGVAETAIEQVARRSLLPAVPANDAPANDARDPREVSTRPDGSAPAAALAAAPPAPADVPAPARGPRRALAAALLALCAAGAVFATRAARTPAPPPAVTPTPIAPVAPRASAPAPPAPPIVVPGAPAAPSTPEAASVPAAPASRVRRGRVERAPVATPVVASPTAPPVAPPVAVTAPPPPAPVPPPPSAAPPPANDRRVRYTTDY